MTSERDASAFELVTVQSGARSVRSLACGETFHPVIGPMQEAVALHVRGQRLPARVPASGSAFVVWDVGLGAAANAIAVLEALDGFEVDMHSFDSTRAPLAFARTVAAELEYLVPWTDAVDALLAHGEWCQAGKGVRWIAHWGDFRECMARAPAPQAVLYDPYSPRANPELWTLEHFTALRARIGDGVHCLLTNYTRSTAVRVTLLLAGFFVGRGGATGEKDQTTVAANRAGLLDDPLDAVWLARVSRSTRGAPLRAGDGAGGAISAEDWARLAAHPQFR